ncbi:armadillo-type protein [Pelomyxa schiedti]|nr:armadillo-type protein [Pelomyxa schiedti]
MASFTVDKIVNDMSLSAQCQNPDNKMRKRAEAEMLLFEQQQGCPMTIMKIAAQRDIVYDVRWLALTYVKNMIARIWDTTISASEKDTVKSLLLELLDEQNEKIAAQVPLAISAIASYDFPLKWPNLLEKLVQAIIQKAETAETLQQHLTALRSLSFVVNLFNSHLAGNTKPHSVLPSQVRGANRNATPSVVHTGATPGPGEDAAAFIKRVAMPLLQAIATAWVPCLDALVNSCSQPNQAVHKLVAEVAHMGLKVVMNLMLTGTVVLSNDILDRLLHNMKVFISCRINYVGHPMTNHCLKQLTRISKSLVRLQDKQPEAVAGHLSGFMQFYWDYLQHLYDTSYVSNPDTCSGEETLAIAALSYYHLTLTNNNYTSACGAPAAVPEGERALNAFFTPDRIRQLSKMLLTRFMLNSDEVLESWKQDPESFADEDIRGAWQSSVQGCSEVILFTLFHNYTKIVVPDFVALLNTFLTTSNPTDLNWVKQKDALYWAIAIGAADLRKLVNFENLLVNHLVRDLQNPEPNLHMLRRRMGQILVLWAGGIPSNLLGTVYNVLITLMRDTDYVTQMWATVALRNIILEPSFELSSFQEFMPTAVQALILVVEQSSESYANTELIGVITVLCKQLGTKIHPFASMIVNSLGHLWARCAGKNLILCEILRVASSLVKAIGPGVSEIESLILPFIRASTAPTKEAQGMAEGLDLWFALIENVQTPNTDTLLLFETMPAILAHQYSLEHRDLVQQLLMQYLLKSPPQYLPGISSVALPEITKILSKPEISSPMLSNCCHTLRRLAFLSPQTLSEMALPLQALVKLMPTKSTTDLLHIFGVFSQCIMCDTGFFAGFINMLTTMHPNSPTPVMHSFIDMWLAKIPSIHDTGPLSFSLGFVQASALANLLVLLDPALWSRLPTIVSFFALVCSLTENKDRRFSLGNEDKTQLRTYIIQKLQEAAQRHGAPFVAVLNSIDQNVMRLFV